MIFISELCHKPWARNASAEVMWSWLFSSAHISKTSNKFDCLVNEMLFNRDLKPTLNVQSDSIRSKVFI